MGYRDLTISYVYDPGDPEPYPQTLNPSQDAVDTCGININDYNGGSPLVDLNVQITRTGNDLVFKDPIAGTKTLTELATASSGVTQEDFLLTNPPVSVDNVYAITLNMSGTVNYETWTNAATSALMKKIQYTYNLSNRVSVVVVRVYASNGITITAQTTETFAYSGDTVTGSTVERDV